MTLKLSELNKIVQEFPLAIHAGERRMGVFYPPPDIESWKKGPLPEETVVETFLFESVAFFRTGEYHYSYRWKLVTPVHIIFDNGL